MIEKEEEQQQRLSWEAEMICKFFGTVTVMRGGNGEPVKYVWDAKTQKPKLAKLKDIVIEKQEEN